MTEQQDVVSQELARLSRCLYRIFEHLPQSGEDRAVVCEKVGYIRAMVWWALLGEEWLNMTDDECNRAVEKCIREYRYGGEWLLPKGERA